MVRKISIDQEPLSKITLERVTLSDSESQSLILKNVDFEIQLNRNYHVMSSEQSHSSSFLKFISLLNEPQAGALQYDQLNVTQSQFDDILPLRMRIGYAFDYGGLMSNRNLLQNLLLPLDYHSLYSRKEREERAFQSLKWFDLQNLKDKFPAEVSGKVRKLVCLLRSFIHAPQILVLDDPTIGLTNDMKETLVQVLKEQIQKGTIKFLIFTSHDPLWIDSFPHDEIIIEDECLYLSPRDGERRAS